MRHLQIIATADVYVADPPIEDGLRDAFRELASAERARAEAEAEAKRLCRALALKLVQPPSSSDREELLRQAITQRDAASAMTVKLDRLIVELGQSLWHEQNPGQRLMMNMRPERARRMVGL